MAKMMSYETAVKTIPEGFQDTVNSASREELEKIVVDAEKQLKELAEKESEDAQYQAAKELASDLRKGYTEARKALSAKVVVALHRHTEIGG